MMEEGVKLHNHLTKFNISMAQVVNAQEKLKDEEKVLLLLRSLPKSYKLLVQTMLVGETTLNLKDVNTILLENYRWLESKSSNGSGESLAMQGSSRGRNHNLHGGGP